MALIAALPGTLEYLDIEETGCGDKSMVALATALPRFLELQHLTCCHNPIGPAGWTALGRALPSVPCLEWLSASDCANMGDAGMAGLVAQLHRCVSLENLWIERDCIGATGAAALAHVLPKCRKLRVLEITGNDLGPEGADPLRRAARRQLEIEWTKGRDHVPLW